MPDFDKPFCPLCEKEYLAGTKFCPEDGSELIIRAEETITGQVFDGRYNLLFKLGEGGMGAVYKATQISTGKPVAIKVVSKKLAQNPATVSRFQREVKLQSKLEHPNIVTVVDFAKTPDGQYFFVMPFVEGKSLRQLILDEGKFSVKDFLTLACQILDGLEFAHQQKIIHRDLKGDNISIAIYQHHRVAKILDFGLAKAIQQESEATMSGSGGTQEGRVLGTPAYMSPEQALGEISKIDHRSDIYSIGVVFYQMLTGKLPFASNTPWGVMHKHIEETPDPLRNIAPGTPEKIEAVILRCLEKDRDKRYQSALDVKKNLEIAATGGDPDVTEDYASRQEEKTSATQDILEPSAHTTFTKDPPSKGWGAVKTTRVILQTLLLFGIVTYFGYTQYEASQEKARQAEIALAQMTADNQKKENEEKSRVVVEKRREGEGETRLAKEKEAQRLAEVKKNKQAEEAKQKAEADQKTRIANLLASAEADIKAYRLTSPAGKNAFERYKAVLKIEPDNKTAKSGIEKVASRYVKLAEDSIKKKEFNKADTFIAKAETVQPGREDVAQTIERLSATREVEKERQRLVGLERKKEESRKARALEEAKAKKRAPKGMVFVKGGCFDMGDTFGDGQKDEKPVHRVCLDDFFMDKYEVTQSSYKQVTGKNPSRFHGENNPVEKVTWFNARDYCSKAGKRLPTEAEWEYAARSGGKREKYAGGNNVDSAGWYTKNSGGKTHPVGQKRGNGLGLYDMSGNVWEWVNDWYGKSYYGSSRERNPRGPSSGKYRVVRGGSWFVSNVHLRASDRYSHTPANRNSTIGFRCAQ